MTTTSDDEARQAAFEQALDGVRFPVTRDQLVAWADGGDARDAVVTDLRSLRDREFGSWPELMEALGVDGARGLDVPIDEPPETGIGDPEQGRSLNKSAPVRED